MPESPALHWLRRAPAGISGGAARLGVLSGTFNPPTRAHLALAQRAFEQFALDEVLLVVPEVPPHRRGLEASLEDRAAMLALLAELDPRLSAAVSRGGLFLEIAAEVAPHYPPGTRQYFLAGRDAAERILLNWPYPNPAQALSEMFAHFDVIVAERGGPFVVPQGSPVERFRSHIHALKMPSDWADVSATEVRRRLARGQSVEALLPPAVAAYIVEKKLYTGAGKAD